MYDSESHAMASSVGFKEILVLGTFSIGTFSFSKELAEREKDDNLQGRDTVGKEMVSHQGPMGLRSVTQQNF